ncbi:MAG: hypothetical protein HOV97_05495 [Nonomuraea sp.]|nr:hypothetical protein [Nonomuraea sp.]
MSRAKRRARFTRLTGIDTTGLDHRQARRLMRRDGRRWFIIIDETARFDRWPDHFKERTFW